MPASFVWVLAAGVASLVGVALASAGGIRGERWVHDLGRGLLLQGLFSGLVLGIGGLLLPLITRGEPPPAAPTPQAARERKVHVLAAIGFFAGFWLEARGR